MQKTYVFRKNIIGGLGFNLESYDMTLPVKTFQMPNGVDRCIVPSQYALGLFVSREAFACFKMGMFTVDSYEELVKEGMELGLCGAEESPEIYELVKIEAMVKNNDIKKIRVLLAEQNPIAANLLIQVAKEHYDTLTQKCRETIEQACGVELGADE